MILLRMDLARSMGYGLFADRWPEPAVCLRLAILLASTSLIVGTASGESVSPRDLDDIAKLRATQGRSVEDTNGLIEQMNRAAARGLPTEPLANKIKEGLAKGVEPKRIEPVLRDLVGRFDAAQQVFNEFGGRQTSDASGGRSRAIEVLADAVARGVSLDEARQLGRRLQPGSQRPASDALASGAKSLALMKEAGVPVEDGMGLVAEALRQGFRSADLLDLGREIKRRGRDSQDARAGLKAIQEAVARGERPDRMFRDGREDRSGRSADRPDRSGRGDTRSE